MPYLCSHILSFDLRNMGRQKNDGRGRIGGRTAGTPNKEKPLKTFLRSHSLAYFIPDEKTGRSLYDNDIMQLEPKERVSAELALLKFHTPLMQATAVDMSLSDSSHTLTDRLTELAKDC